jgi:hypothetical protein
MFFVDNSTLFTLRAAKAGSDYDSDGDSYRQPDANVAGRDTHRGADAGAESDAKDNLHGWSFHFLFLKTA